MSGSSHLDGHARVAYDGFAPFYDAFTAHHDYEAWTRDLEALARDAGLHGRGHILDVACGTGKSFLPFLDRGWQVTACDVSPAMVELAASKAGPRATVAVHDVRALPVIGSFELVVCLDDALNYLLDPEDVTVALGRMRANLAPGGVVLFDLNSIRTYREAFGTLDVMSTRDLVIIWRGEVGSDFQAGARASAVTQVLDRSGRGWRESCQRHHQRHHPVLEVREALLATGLSLGAIRGMDPDGTMLDDFDELTCTKAVYVATADQAQSPGTGTRGT